MFLLHALLSILPYLFLGWLFMFNGDSSPSFSLRVSFWNLFVHYGFLLAQIVFVLWLIIRSRNLTLLGLLLIFFASCGSRERFNVHVSDFEGAQQVVLKRILTDGFADALNKQDDSLFTDQDLLRLTNSESPLLRAVALDELKRRQGTGFGKIGINHLDDTAFVLHDHGEFGLGFETVTDVALELSKWPDSLSRLELLKRLLEQPYKHRSVYIALRNLDSISSFYPVIRQMAFQSTRDVDGYEKRFEERENALYALARFRRIGDANRIIDEIAKNPGLISNTSLNLLKDFPDTCFLDFIEYYHRRFFYRIINNQTDGFSGYQYDKVDAESFIEAVAAQHNQRGARILDTMMQWLPKIKCSRNLDYVIGEVEDAIGQQDVEAFAWLRRKYRLPKRTEDSPEYPIQVEAVDLHLDTSVKVFMYHPWR
jgi:hypothetical protein